MQHVKHTKMVDTYNIMLGTVINTIMTTTYSIHPTLAARYQLVQSVMKIDFVLVERVG